MHTQQPVVLNFVELIAFFAFWQCPQVLAPSEQIFFVYINLFGKDLIYEYRYENEDCWPFGELRHA